SQGAGKNNVAIQQRTDRIDERVLLIVALHEHRVKGGDGAGAKLPGPLDEAGEPGEDRGRIALGRGWLSRGEADFASRHGEASERIENQENVFSLGGKELGD